MVTKDMRTIGTSAYGIRTPLIKEGDDLEKIVVESVVNSGLEHKDKDIVGMTESLVARTQRNFVSLDIVAKDVVSKFGDIEIGVVHPIFSRNRFSLILRAVAQGVKKVYVLLNEETDEVGNSVLNPYTGIDIKKYYESLSDNIEVIHSNDPTKILNYTHNVLVASIHNRFKNKEIIEAAATGQSITIHTLSDIMTESIDGSGYNPEYGLLGSNYSTEQQLKLFPRDCWNIVDRIQIKLKEATGKNIEVIIYGDGAFKDPACGIWELADPVVSPGFTKGLRGTPSEIKLKFLLDQHKMSDEQVIEKLKEKNASQHESLGTTPRQIPDLVGSLCDLVSGSGDKGTPVVYIQGYFDNYSSE